MKVAFPTTLIILTLLAISCQKENISLNTSVSTEHLDQNASSNDVSELRVPVVRIGHQIWMSKNLNVGRYRNGDLIPHVTDPNQWGSLTTGAWCWYNNDSVTYHVYGKLYNWYAINDPRGLVPKGWHVPDNAEWDTLASALGGSNIAGGKMKDTGTLHWMPPNLGATNSSGFTAFAGGERNSYGFEFDAIGYFGVWWSTTPGGSGNFWVYSLNYNEESIDAVDFYPKNEGVSVRCVRDGR